MLVHEAYNTQDIEAIIDQVQTLFLQFCMPVRDFMIQKSMTQLKQRVVQMKTIAQFLVIFIDTLESVLVVMKDDMNEYLKSVRFQKDYEILTSSEGQEWLKRKNEQ